jgi:hypothetical protein
MRRLMRTHRSPKFASYWNAPPAFYGILDFGFIVQRSKDMARFEKFMGLNGDTAYLLMAYHKSDMLFDIATVGKAPPLSWLNRWLA